ncbi:MAG: type II secretion system protein [Synergistaceae bacterium]|nr:type II secretion system protein [Synergistaceae bacterium]
MKKFRKGFTLLELLVVIGVMGILSTTAMIAGQEATNGARATTIAEGLEKAASAMMMYYADNAEVIAKEGAEAADIATGANAYLKTADALESGNTGVEGKYRVVINPAEKKAAQEWWIEYTLPATDVDGIGLILKNKVTRMGLTSDTSSTAYDGTGATVMMKVRGKLAAAADPATDPTDP